MFAAPAVKLKIKYLLPRAKIELPFCDRYDNFPSHNGSFKVRVGVVLTGQVVAVFAGGRVWCQPFQPFLLVRVQSTLIIVNKYTGCNVHGVDQA